MPLRWQEVALPLFVIFALIVLKYVPVTAHLPLSRAAGVVAFGYAAFLALRLVQPEEAIQIDGWAELRPSMVEYFACYGAAALAAVLLMAVIVMGGSEAVDTTQVVATYLAVLMLGAGSLGIGLAGLFTRVRWNHRSLEHRNAFGRETEIDWAEVQAVRANWRGVTIAAGAKRVTFSQFHGGAAQLAKHATMRARRNTQTARGAMVA